MGLKMKGFMIFHLVLLLWCDAFLATQAMLHNYTFIIQETSETRLCSSKKILTVNGQFPGPTLRIREGDTTLIRVINNGTQNITIHWHGVKQPRNPWSDGPEYITQCPIMPGSSFTQRILLSDEVGTLWWHAHSDWSRATVHGPIIVYPKIGDSYPFRFDSEVPIVLGEWWKSDIQAVLDEFVRTGSDPNISDAFLINGQPGDLYSCSKQDTFKLSVQQGKTYLVRMVNSVMNTIMFFSIANHKITVVGSDGSYTKQLTSDYITISPGQTIDFLLHANQTPDHYYMAAKAYNSAPNVRFDNTTTTGIIEYVGNYTPSSPPVFPTNFPLFNDTNASTSFTGSLRSLPSQVNVPTNIDAKLFFTFSINLNPCGVNQTCSGRQPPGTRFASSVNNITFQPPTYAILQAYYNNLTGVYDSDFPSIPPSVFNYTANNITFVTSEYGTKVHVLEYNASVEIVFQGTNIVAGIDHPIHLHGHSFYVVGWGIGNFDAKKDPLNYNLVDPPLMNTIAVPKNGWTTIRFKANNPGVWFMHCHIERHLTWGMEMAFLIKNGRGLQEQLFPPPLSLPPC